MSLFSIWAGLAMLISMNTFAMSGNNSSCPVLDGTYDCGQFPIWFRCEVKDAHGNCLEMNFGNELLKINGVEADGVTVYCYNSTLGSTLRKSFAPSHVGQHHPDPSPYWTIEDNWASTDRGDLAIARSGKINNPDDPLGADSASFDLVCKRVGPAPTPNEGNNR